MSVELPTGKVVFMPLMTYCYINLKTSMQHLLNNADFFTSCGKELTQDQTMYCTVWMMEEYGKNFWWVTAHCFSMNHKIIYALLLNLDWFQPYKHLTYSVGVIYITVLNFPSHQRHLKCNTSLVAVLPRPHEPKGTVNTFKSVRFGEIFL